MQKLQWETKKVKVKDLIPLDINPRKISEEKKKKLVESLEKFNLVEIPAVNTDMQIIGGNQRVTALMLVGRGEELINVRMPNRKLTTKEVKEYTIISNTHAGEFDFEILSLEFADINLAEYSFDTIVSPNIGNTDAVNMVNHGNENDEWVGMPDLEKLNPGIHVSRLYFIFDTETERNDWLKTNKITDNINKTAQGWIVNYCIQHT